MNKGIVEIDILRDGVRVTADDRGSPRSIDMFLRANAMKLTRVVGVVVGERAGMTEVTLRLVAPFEYEGLVTLNTFQLRPCGCPCFVHTSIEQRILHMKLDEIAALSTSWTPEGERLPMVGNFRLDGSREHLEATADQIDFDLDAPSYCDCVCSCTNNAGEDA